MRSIFYILYLLLIYINVLNSKRKSTIPSKAYKLHYGKILQPLSRTPMTVTDVNFHVVVPKYKLHSCLLGKNFSTMMSSIFCYLFNPKLFQSKNDHLKDNYWKKNVCRFKNNEHHLGPIIRKFNGNRSKDFRNDWKHLLIVRNPVDRFISAYIHLCINLKKKSEAKRACFGCKDGIKCVLNNIYYRMNAYVSKRTPIDHYLTYHFLPQTWQCHYSQFKKVYTIIKYDQSNLDLFYRNISNVLLRQNVPESFISFIDKEMRSTRTHHTTSNSMNVVLLRNYITQNEYARKMLALIYFNDFKEFGYEFPLYSNNSVS
uniref:Sulfotransfer_1 domain-containing protein n=1 Tax=Parastrongyloides trichosuri TaxID=131310 RepID=A0A0N4ZW10_PARTI